MVLLEDLIPLHKRFSAESVDHCCGEVLLRRLQQPLELDVGNVPFVHHVTVAGPDKQHSLRLLQNVDISSGRIVHVRIILIIA